VILGPPASRTIAMPGERGPHGWLVVDKPLGMSSARAVEIVRRRTGAKAGHAGTLDPLATGVLPVALGEATKTVRYAVSAGKCYRFRIRWGIARATEDGEGEIVAESTARPTAAAIEAMLPRFCGWIEQSPPAYSAVKIGGRRAYALARAAMPPSLPARPVEIAALRLIAIPDPDHADFTAAVGKGTYIRALARDLAAALGTLGHVAALRRVSVGCFTEAQAISLESLGQSRDSEPCCGHLLPIEAVLDGIPALPLAEAEAARLRCGQRVMPSGSDVREQLVRLDRGAVVSAWQGSVLVAIARIEDRGLQPLRVINL
jgi:tRNA pseudouridine55 synthase